jgi:PAS domain S-box-containing protein
VRQLQRLGLIIMGVILLTQIGLHLFVVRPAVQFVGREIEQTEVQYQGLVESMTDGLVVFDPSGTIEFANRRFGSLLGYGAEGLAGKPASLFIADPDRRRFSAMLFDPHLETEPVDLVMRHVDGRLIETMISPQRLRDHLGVSRGLLLVVTDVTSRKAIEHRSRELLDQLAHADRLRAMGAMAAALAHEINQPLGAIANYAEGCLTRLSGPPIDSQDFVLPLEKILRATHRGAEIIRRARGFVRLRPHRITQESINSLVHEVEEMCRPEARRRGISLELQLATEPLTIPVDAIQIQQVLTNLIQNAFAAMDQVEPYRRRISLTTGTASTGVVEVTVADTGPGIPDDGAEAWFEPFMTTREEGTGMGLAIARSIVEAHGGRIWAETNGEGGAVFRFTLPLESPTVDVSGESLPLMEAVSHV